MQILKKIAFSSVEESGGGPTLLLSYRSTGVVINTGTLCVSETADNAFYLFSASFPAVITGDIAYNTNNLSSPYNGANKYFKVYYSILPDTDSFIVQINPSGVITVITDCSP